MRVTREFAVCCAARQGCAEDSRTGELRVRTRREVLKYAGLGAGVAAASALGVKLNAERYASQAHGPRKAAPNELTGAVGKRPGEGPEDDLTKAATNAA